MSKPQTDNSYLEDKILLRLNSIPQKDVLNVVDAYHGKGTIWKNIQKRYPGEINVVKIDKEKKDDDSFVFLGFNEKYLSSLDLKKFDVIDLDAYGIPAEQMKIIFESGFSGICFVTFIQVSMGGLPHDFLKELGYTKKMIEKAPTLFSKKGFDKLCSFLWLHGVKKVKVRRHARKAYLAFRVSG